jgi:hypothetical protein
LKKDELKIIDVQINPRDTTQFHLHRYPMFLSLGVQKAADQAPNSNWIVSDVDEEWPNGETASDTSYINKPVVHRVTRGTNYRG